MIYYIRKYLREVTESPISYQSQCLHLFGNISMIRNMFRVWFIHIWLYSRSVHVCYVIPPLSRIYTIVPCSFFAHSQIMKLIALQVLLASPHSAIRELADFCYPHRSWFNAQDPLFQLTCLCMCLDSWRAL